MIWDAPQTPKTMRITINEIGANTILYDYFNTNQINTCSSFSEWNSWSYTLDKTPVHAGKVEANIIGSNQINITTENVKNFKLWLDPRMGIDTSQQVTVIVNGVSKKYSCNTSLLNALQSYVDSKDWGMIYNCSIDDIVVP